jgi:hypothetical protein
MQKMVCSCSRWQSGHLGESLGRVALVGSDDLAAGELGVGVGRVDDELALVVDDGEGGEALAGAELAAPAGGNGVVAALERAAVGGGGVLGLDGVGARDALGGAGAGLDAEEPVALGVGGVAVAAEALDGPLGSGGHHGDGLNLRGGSSEGAGGREDGSDDGELHVCGWWFGSWRREEVVWELSVGV